MPDLGSESSQSAAQVSPPSTVILPPAIRERPCRGCEGKVEARRIRRCFNSIKVNRSSMLGTYISGRARNATFYDLRHIAVSWA
jgi:hypothetical protein